MIILVEVGSFHVKHESVNIHLDAKRNSIKDNPFIYTFIKLDFHELCVIRDEFIKRVYIKIIRQ